METYKAIFQYFTIIPEQTTNKFLLCCRSSYRSYAERYSTIKNHLTRIKSAQDCVSHRPGTFTHTLLKKILSRETDFHQNKIHFKLHQKSHSILQVASFLLFLTTHRAVQTANFARQDVRISWCHLPKENSI